MRLSLMAAALTAVTLLGAGEARAQAVSYACNWSKVGEPFQITVDGQQTRLAGSLAIFGEEAPTIRDRGHFVVRLRLAQGFVVFRWPEGGGVSAVGFFNEAGELQGGYQRAALCRLG